MNTQQVTPLPNVDFTTPYTFPVPIHTRKRKSPRNAGAGEDLQFLVLLHILLPGCPKFNARTCTPSRKDKPDINVHERKSNSQHARSPPLENQQNSTRASIPCPGSAAQATLANHHRRRICTHRSTPSSYSPQHMVTVCLNKHGRRTCVVLRMGVYRTIHRTVRTTSRLRLRVQLRMVVMECPGRLGSRKGVGPNCIADKGSE
jgi:hypothetical protein